MFIPVYDMKMFIDSHPLSSKYYFPMNILFTLLLEDTLRTTVIRIQNDITVCIT